MIIAKIEPEPSLEEAAAIEAALRQLFRKSGPRRSKWATATLSEFADFNVANKFATATDEAMDISYRATTRAWGV